MEARSKELKKHGRGNKSNAAEAITDEEVNILFEKNLLGISNPNSATEISFSSTCSYKRIKRVFDSSDDDDSPSAL